MTRVENDQQQAIKDLLIKDLVAERDRLLQVLETRAEREMEMLAGVAKENDALVAQRDALYEVIAKHATQLEWALGFNENGSLSPHGVAYVLEAQQELTAALPEVKGNH